MSRFPLNSLVTALALLAASQHAGTVKGEYSFVVRNTYDLPVTLQFFRTEHEERWLDKDYLVYPRSVSREPIVLASEQPHTIEILDDGGKKEQLWKVDLFQLVGRVHDNERTGREPPVIYLRQLILTEQKTQTYTVEVMAKEEREETCRVPRQVSETRTRQVWRRDRRTGRTYLATETYTVCVNVTEMRTRTVTVMVPRLEERTRTIVVKVPRLQLSVIDQGLEQVLESSPHEVELGPDGPRDNRRRFLGVGLGDVNGKAVVTSVEAGSPATRLTRLGTRDGRQYRLVSERHAILEVSGRPVSSSAELVDAIQLAPPVVILTVLDRQTGKVGKYRVRLEMR